jgi:pyridoxamine 5'-phosphate oxidase
MDMNEMDAESSLDPIALFHVWMKKAESTEPNDPSAAALATATRDGVPSVRMVLIKRVDQRGFSFYTNSESQKGLELAENPRAELCFHWKSLRRQVRVSGTVTELPPADADDYFRSRSRLSQLSAAASRQSQVLVDRDLLLARVRELDERFPGEIPRPKYWRGFVLWPERIEFWTSGEGRLHDRILFLREGEGWRKERLFP